jgi:hypothetical protein
MKCEEIKRLKVSIDSECSATISKTLEETENKSINWSTKASSIKPKDSVKSNSHFHHFMNNKTFHVIHTWISLTKSHVTMR